MGYKSKFTTTMRDGSIYRLKQLALFHKISVGELIEAIIFGGDFEYKYSHSNEIDKPRTEILKEYIEHYKRFLKERGNE